MSEVQVWNGPKIQKLVHIHKRFCEAGGPPGSNTHKFNNTQTPNLIMALSLSLYIYIYIYMCVYMYFYMFIYLWTVCPCFFSLKFNGMLYTNLFLYQFCFLLKYLRVKIQAFKSNCFYNSLYPSVCRSLTLSIFALPQ